MSYLIDSFKDASCEIKGKWWISKPSQSKHTNNGEMDHRNFTR